MLRLLLSAILLSFLSSTVSAQEKITIAKDGTGKFSSVQQVLDAISPGNKKPITIYIKNGIYKEKIHLDSSKNYITITGEDKFKTILTFDDHAGKVTRNGDTINTRTSASFLVRGDNFTAENLTIQNDAGLTAG